MGDLVEGKVVLVTGAASGIGRAAALLFSREGARAVVVADIEADLVDETAELLRAEGGTALALEVDIADAGAVDAMVTRAVDEFGRLDCAFNNAGVAGAPARTADCTDENWNFVIGVMLTGTWLCMRRELRQMLLQGGGAIVNTASVASFVASPRCRIHRRQTRHRRAHANGRARVRARQHPCQCHLPGCDNVAHDARKLRIVARRARTDRP
jgi:NAD(P)-dependent dehydrogenase (short-subunit alcohol dehydrogenase family)